MYIFFFLSLLFCIAKTFEGTNSGDYYPFRRNWRVSVVRVTDDAGQNGDVESGVEVENERGRKVAQGRRWAANQWTKAPLFAYLQAKWIKMDKLLSQWKMGSSGEPFIHPNFNIYKHVTTDSRPYNLARMCLLKIIHLDKPFTLGAQVAWRGSKLLWRG